MEDPTTPEDSRTQKFKGLGSFLLPQKSLTFPGHGLVSDWEKVIHQTGQNQCEDQEATTLTCKICCHVVSTYLHWERSDNRSLAPMVRRWRRESGAVSSRIGYGKHRASRHGQLDMLGKKGQAQTM